MSRLKRFPKKYKIIISIIIILILLTILGVYSLDLMRYTPLIPSNGLSLLGVLPHTHQANEINFPQSGKNVILSVKYSKRMTFFYEPLAF